MSEITKRRRGKGRPFQKGVSGNPGGRPKDELVYLQHRYNLVDLEKSLSSYLQMPIEELLIKANDKSIPAIDGVVIRILIEAMREGDPKRLDFILNRLIGRVPERIMVANIDTSTDEKLNFYRKELENVYERIRIVGPKKEDH